MRGKASPPHFTGGKNRITPAYAGKSLTEKQKDVFGKDHPRLCGEKKLQTKRSKLDKGSPPPMRGKAPAYDPKQANNRITPAYAGKSSDCTAGKSWSWDHPRLCGEKNRAPQNRSKIPGSPPPMRGKAVIDYATSVIWGITPAYAGKSTSFQRLPCSC